ncbi:MAG TPA: ABC transporter permease [Vicinamibacterales bacterium]|jgi:putative ABC transport system permease protein
MRWTRRWYRAVLRLYPSEFRDEYGSEMTRVVDEHADDGRGLGPIALLADAARSLPKEHADVLLRDVNYAFRTMRMAPVFALAVILTVALAVGANTLIFSVVNTVLIRALPFAAPSRLMQVAEKNDKLNWPAFSASVLNYLSWKEQTRTFTDLGAVGPSTFNLSGSGDPEQFSGARISPSVMPILGIHPVLGRGFAEGDDQPGAAPVVMISEGLWKRRFGGDRSIVGRSLEINGADATLVGVAPASLSVLTNGDMWTPLTIDPGREIRLNHVIFVIGRLKDGVTHTQAQAEMDTVAAHVGQQYPEVKDWGIRLVDFHHTFVSSQLQTGILVLFGAVACVLLIACANVANLLLARAAARQKEIAIRTAMGASRARLLRQLLAESLSLSIIGGVLGVATALWAVPIVNAALPVGLLPVPDIAIDRTVLLFAVFVTCATGLIFGFVPAWHGSNSDVNSVLKQVSRSATGGTRPIVRNGLAAAELALATVLLVGAGLLVQSLLQLQRVQVGFDPSGVVSFQVSLPAAKYPTDKATAFHRRLVDSLASIPGVEAAAVSSGIPFGVGNYTTTPMTPAGSTVLPVGTAMPIDWRVVSPDFFRVLRIPLLRGRVLSDADGPSSPTAAVISQTTAQQFWGSDDPIGRSFQAGGRTYNVVGVVGDVRNTALNQDSPTAYYPSAARVWPLMDVVVRTSLRPDGLMPAIRQKVGEIDSQLPVSNVRTLEDWVSNGASQPRLNAVLLAAFAAVALAIAAVGVYGVLAYTVTQRTREMGLRMALGAPRGRVLRLVVREGMTVGVAGIGAGLLAALVLSQALASLVFGVAVHDPFTFSVASGALGVVALAACSIPAWKASRVDPMVALRDE